jgi:hypothetical protein
MAMIPQKLLREYFELKLREQKLKTDRIALRNRIIATIKSGAILESGTLSCRVRVSRIRRLTRTTITKAFGLEFYERLAAGVEPDEQISLHVFDSADRPNRRFQGNSDA